MHEDGYYVFIFRFAVDHIHMLQGGLFISSLVFQIWDSLWLCKSLAVCPAPVAHSLAMLFDRHPWHNTTAAQVCFENPFELALLTPDAGVRTCDSWDIDSQYT